MSAFLELRNVSKHYQVPVGGLLRRKSIALKAVDGIDLSIEKGSSFGIAGESGSGKSTLAKLVLLLEKSTDGKIMFDGKDVGQFDAGDVAQYRTRIQAVFQDASGSLNPRMRIGDIVGEPLEIQRIKGNKDLSKSAIRERTEEMLHLVGLPKRMMFNFPHELSGGQKQRVSIARAMILNPSMLLLDEPVSALDVSIRAQILNLLSDFQERFGLTYLMISHDLATLGHVSAQIAIMYLGKIVEIGDTDEIYAGPLHPYTKGLFAAMPVADPTRVKAAASIRGEIGSSLNIPRGCRFAPRCDAAMAICRETEPKLVTVGSRRVACHLVSGTPGAVGLQGEDL